MPLVICTGYEITDALRKYLEVGHGIDFDKKLSIVCGEDDEPDESNRDVDQQALAMQREGRVVMSYRDYFRHIRGRAPAEVRKTLEIPYKFSKWAGHGLRHYMFIPTGAYTREYYKSGGLDLKFPPEEDRKAIQLFIDAANSLLPNDAAREKAGFKLEDMRFEVHSPRALKAPIYFPDERKELLPPRHLRAFLKCSA